MWKNVLFGELKCFVYLLVFNKLKNNYSLTNENKECFDMSEVESPKEEESFNI